MHTTRTHTFTHTCMANVCQVSIFQAAPTRTCTPSCWIWMPNLDLEATQRSVDYV